MLSNSGTRVAHWLADWLNHSGYGVDVFFSLSGYLICYLLLIEKQRSGTISLCRFYVRRAFRILPPMLLFLIFIILIANAGFVPTIDKSEIYATLFFYRNYLIGSWYTRHFWSLALEEQFYAVIPLLLLLTNRRWAVRGAFVLIVMCIGIRWFEYAHGLFSDSIVQFRTENRFDGLMWGGLLALAMQDPPTRHWLQRNVTGWLFTALIAILPGLLLVFSSQPSRRTLVAACIPLLIAYTVLHPDGVVGRMLELPGFKWIGRLSYSLYIWQMMFLVPDNRPLGAFQSFPLNFICIVVLAVTSYYALEKPMIKLGHRLAGYPQAWLAGRTG